MSEAQNTEATPEATAQEPETDAPEAKVDEIDWKAKAREWERRAKENKSAADELATIKESQKSEAEKAADALAEAKAEAEAARTALLRMTIANKHGITDADDIDLFLTGADEETLTKQAQRLAERSQSESKPRSPKPDPNQGRPGAGPASTAEQFAASVGGFFKN